MNNHYIEIDGLDYDVAKQALGEISDTNFKLAMQQFGAWYENAERDFYPDQLHYLSSGLLNHFCRERNIADSDIVFEDYDLHSDYRDYQAYHGLDSWQAKYNEWQYWHSLNSNRQFINLIENLDSFASLLDTGENTGASLNYLPKLIPAWFNAQIHNDSDKQSELRKMPYPEYLKSYHWQFTRALTIFTFQATCMGKPCEWNRNEGMWFLYAQHRHVHHLSYKNRGNERFGDVCVLCDECHEALHKQKADIVDSEQINNWLKTQWHSCQTP